MTFVEDFEASLSDLREMLSDLERLEKAVEPGGNLHKQLSAISVIRSTTYIVAYNAIERAFRAALYAVRQAVISEDMLYHDVSEFWRRDALRHCLHELLSQGSRHDTLYQKIDAFFATTPAWDSRNVDLPFPGNINHTAICDFCDKLGIRLSAHRSARGGSDLETIRRNRNSLAHGHEKFSDVGATVTINDLKDTYHRATIFMRAVLRALEDYIQKRRYVQPSHRRSIGTAPRGPSASSALGSRPMP
jgi:hypothetical protein